MKDVEIFLNTSYCKEKIQKEINKTKIVKITITMEDYNMNNKNNKILNEYYVLKHKDGNEFFAMDSGSGGYPYLTKDLTDSYKFKNLTEFEEFKNDHYYKLFEKELKNCNIVKIVVTMEE